MKSNEKLLEQGIIVLSGPVNKETIPPVIEDIIRLNEDKDLKVDAIRMILSSTGGNTWCSFALTDIIEFSRLPVKITGLGVCASAGLMILCGGTKGHRVITKNTSLLAHQYQWGSYGKHHELLAQTVEFKREHERIAGHFVKHTNLNKTQVNKLLLPESDVWLSHQDALKYGLIDKVV